MDKTTLVEVAYLVSATLFVFGLKRLGSPATARRGNQLASLAMLVAVVAAVIEHQILNWGMVGLGLILGSLVGAVLARRVQMTSMPELVGIFNGLGGGASAVVAAAEFVRLSVAPSGLPGM
ncbi:MAG: NAD(P)(+) transhydrogenase (Re/Si-specific) subunit beta, partial [Gemmatimonadota bacterium]